MNRRGGTIVRVTPEQIAEEQRLQLAHFTEMMNLGEEPCSPWWGNPSLNWDIELEDRCDGPMGFAWTR